ncbi:hypothetical protein ETAE_0590 [Edwardsiella piscicida]|uniref:Uncharacterized protein n=1 Tax=Edwardsiella piscicida TaxID=1263550 RepID=A0AAU8PD52_EDWPI|nr:hypothetical protein ETAE_0590 [Edwardsiella tarda EIB202]
MVAFQVNGCLSPEPEKIGNNAKIHRRWPSAAAAAPLTA